MRRASGGTAGDGRDSVARRTDGGALVFDTHYIVTWFERNGAFSYCRYSRERAARFAYDALVRQGTFGRFHYVPATVDTHKWVMDHYDEYGNYLS